MKASNLPRLDNGYWVAIVAASMCGTNAGDLAAGPMGLGHLSGLFPIALVFFAVLAAERMTSLSTVVFYWCAIILLRTMATNIADLATHELGMSYLALILGLCVLMTGLTFIDQTRSALVRGADNKETLVSADLLYWFAMLTAGVLGTALGDWLADDGLGLAAWQASLLGAPVFLGVLWVAQRNVLNKVWYWAVIVVCRTWGTDLGDMLARFMRILGSRSVALWVSTTLTGTLLVMIIYLWSRRSSVSGSAAAAK